MEQLLSLTRKILSVTKEIESLYTRFYSNCPGTCDLSIWWVFMELWCLCVREVGQVWGRVRITVVVHRDVAQKAVGYTAPWYFESVCLVPVSIGFLFSPAVIWLPIPGESKENGKKVFEGFLVKRVPGWGPEWRESCKTVLYPLIIIIILNSYIIIKLLIKARTIPAKTRHGAPSFWGWHNIQGPYSQHFIFFIS